MISVSCRGSRVSGLSLIADLAAGCQQCCLRVILDRLEQLDFIRVVVSKGVLVDAHAQFGWQREEATGHDGGGEEWVLREWCAVALEV